MFLVLQLGLLKKSLVKASNTSWREVWLENWKYGRWLVGSAALSSVSSQAQVFFVSALLGLEPPACCVQCSYRRC